MAPTDIVQKEMPDSRPMNGGDGANSYTQNSSYQRGAIDSAKAMIFQAISEKLDTDFLSFNSFRIADFGCSTGPNTFIAMQNIIEAVMLKHKSMHQETNPKKTNPEFHLFFNDHVDNDFNTLFKTLPPSWPYFAAGVPGSFYCQLFPSASLHIAFSSYALQWLSKVPSEIIDRNSPAWNKGKIYCAGDDKHVTEAYFAQFKDDMGAFLKARAQELVEGGLMVILMPGVPDGEVLPSQFTVGLHNDLLGDSLTDMVKMGVISEEKLDSFNLPCYLPSTKEVKTVVEMSECFTIEKICTLSCYSDNDLKPLDAKSVCVQMRAVMENIMEVHFGSGNMDQLFHLCDMKLHESHLLYDQLIHQNVHIFALLKRKDN